MMFLNTSKDAWKALICGLLFMACIWAIWHYANKYEDGRRSDCEKSGGVYIAGRVNQCFEKGTVIDL